MATSMNSEEAVRLYVAGRLDGDALEAFEIALFHDEALLSAVEEEQALRMGLSSMERPVAPAAAPVMRSLRRQRWWPIAAAFVFGATSSALVLLRRPGDRSAVVSNVPVLLLETARSATPQRRIFNVPPNAREVLLQIPIVTDTTTRLRLRVVDGQGTERVRVDDLRADSDGLVTLLVPSSRLDAGDYRVELGRAESDGDAATVIVEFRIDR
jgi:hypothetical protein